MSEVILQVTIRGQVQGVGYRAWVEEQALTCGLEGWVRNRVDGSVEALFAGPADIVMQVVALCRRGPRHRPVSRPSPMSPRNRLRSICAGPARGSRCCRRGKWR